MIGELKISIDGVRLTLEADAVPVFTRSALLLAGISDNPHQLEKLDRLLPELITERLELGWTESECRSLHFLLSRAMLTAELVSEIVDPSGAVSPAELTLGDLHRYWWKASETARQANEAAASVVVAAQVHP